jgi:hypothetical protein
MNIKNIKKMAGDVVLIEPLMVVAVLAMIVIMLLTYYKAATKTADPTFIDIVSFANNLNESHSDKELITLSYNEIIPFQQSLFSKIDCSKLLCNPIDLKNYPLNTYLSIHYKDSKFDSFYLYTKTDSSIFKFNGTPYNEWSANNTYDLFQQEQGRLIERELKKNSKLNPAMAQLPILFNNISVYNVLDSDNSVVQKGDCSPTICSSVLAYKNKPIIPQLADNKKAQ